MNGKIYPSEPSIVIETHSNRKGANMKTQILFAILATITGVAAHAADAPALRAGATPAAIFGTAPADAVISAMVFFTPNQTSLAQKKCEFSDDFMNPNGKDKLLSMNAQRSGAQYSVNYSMTASRGQCQYHVTTIYLMIKTSKVDEMYTIVPAETTPASTDIPVLAFKSASPMFCDFQGLENGFCDSDTEMHTYTFTKDDSRIEFNLKDSSEKPVPADDQQVQD